MKCVKWTYLGKGCLIYSATFSQAAGLVKYSEECQQPIITVVIFMLREGGMSESMGNHDSEVSHEVFVG